MTALPACVPSLLPTETTSTKPARTYPEMRVLNDAFWERLGRINAVSRRVVALGWRPVAMDALGTRPALRVEPRPGACPQPLPLGLSASGVLHDHVEGVSHIYVDGVRLTWAAVELDA